MLQYITRKGTFDSGHRVMNQKFKCHNLHGHTYHYELTFQFSSQTGLGYNIDFSEIKRIGGQWIDDHLDHALIVNPCDIVLIEAAEQVESKMWKMSLNGEGNYCNPSVENIARELFLAMTYLFSNREGLSISSITLYETPNCYTKCTQESINLDAAEVKNFNEANGEKLSQYLKEKGIVEYDDRK